MSLLNNNKKDAKKGNKTTKNAAANAKFTPKPGGGAVPKKPVKTGGMRGS